LRAVGHDEYIFADLVLAVMAMRAYAFTGRTRTTLIGLSFCYIVLIAVNLRVFITQNILPQKFFYEQVGPTGCFPNYGIPEMTVHMGVSSPQQVYSLKIS
jgi:hypothetical protein